MSDHRCRAKAIYWKEVQGRGLLVYIRYIVKYESKYIKYIVKYESKYTVKLERQEQPVTARERHMEP